MKNDILKDIRLLYVEDDSEIRTVLSRGLKRRVKELFVAQDGQDGLEQFKTHNPDIILTDIKMPKMTGIEMSQKIKEIDKNKPIIIMSAHSETDFLLESISIGISGYLLKPVDKDRLFETLSSSAKDVLFDKALKEQQMILQEVIDMQPSIIFSADDKNQILFINNSFLTFFCCNEIKDLDTIENKNIEDFLKLHCSNAFLNYKIDNKSLLEYLVTNPNNEALEVLVDQKEEKVPFLLKSKAITFENETKHIVMTLSRKLV